MTPTLRKTPGQKSYRSLSTSEDNISPNSEDSAASNTESDDNDNYPAPQNNNVDTSHSRKLSSSPGAVLLPCTEAKTRTERLSDKIYALLWVSIAGILGWYLDLPHTFLVDPKIHRTPFNIAIVLLMVNLVLMSYLGIYLPKVVGINDSSAWEAYCPRVIPVMTCNGIVCVILGIRSLWPVWGFLTPLILGLEFFGFLYGTQFIPWI